MSTGSVNKTILCIDDHLAGLETRKRVLESRGFNILTASSGQAGLAMLDMSSVDAVLLDYKMEGMDGEAVATEIRRTKPSASSRRRRSASAKMAGRSLNQMSYTMNLSPAIDW